MKLPDDNAGTENGEREAGFEKRKLIFKCNLPPGDIVLLSAAIRDLHFTYPERFVTDVRTHCPEIWEHNPFLTSINDGDPEARKLECRYPLINYSNTIPYHVIHGFRDFLNDKLNLQIQPTLFKGDIHLSDQERTWCSQVAELVGCEIPYWIIAAGGKYDVPIKWWCSERYQEVVDYFKGKIQFVQVGLTRHHHPALRDVIDFRDKTDLRQLIRLVYHSQGVLCPVTSLMHLAAAVQVKPGMPKNRPCVVIAGGREPAQWEAYPHHQFIHRCGALFCCDNGGCWKSHVTASGSATDNACVNVVGKLPGCMEMITSFEVISRIKTYFEGGVVKYLTSEHARIGRRAVRLGQAGSWRKSSLERILFRRSAETFLKEVRLPEATFAGRGVVICAGGATYLASAWVAIRMLRMLGCRLPIEVWYLNSREGPGRARRLFEQYGVSFLNSASIKENFPAIVDHGWQLKPYAIIHSSFNEVLYLDADNVPLVDPTFLFHIEEFSKTGIVLWPDIKRLSPARAIWKICGVPFKDEPEVESGQILVDKTRCWLPLSLALWYNEHSDFFYEHVHGDKETFHMAFRKLKHPYSMPSTPVLRLRATMCQHDFSGRRIFQHRNRAKWTLDGHNPNIEGFLYEKECLTFLDELRRLGFSSRDLSGEEPDDRDKTGSQLYYMRDAVPT